MSNETSENRITIVEEAAEWYLRMQEEAGSPQIRQQLTSWLLESPVHVHEYLAIAQMYSDLADIDPDREIAVAVSGSADETASNIIAIEAGKSVVAGSFADNIGSGHLHWRHALVASFVAFTLLFAGLWLFGEYSAQQRYVTGIGEQRSVPLDDGSVIELNAMSELLVESGDDYRRVTLISGEVLFDIEKDSKRPFTVDMGTAQVRVLGTEFNIYKKSDSAAVTVLEGSVQVGRVEADNHRNKSVDDPVAVTAVKLTAGQQATLSIDSEQITTSVANIDKVIAWRERKLIFEAQPLLEVVAEFNRYNFRQIQVVGAELQALKLSGIFASKDPESLIEFLSTVRDIKVNTHSDGSLILALAGPDPAKLLNR